MLSAKLIQPLSSEFEMSVTPRLRNPNERTPPSQRRKRQLERASCPRVACPVIFCPPSCVLAPPTHRCSHAHLQQWSVKFPSRVQIPILIRPHGSSHRMLWPSLMTLATADWQGLVATKAKKNINEQF